jgi:AraC-like DNA-binding protein
MLSATVRHYSSVEQLERAYLFAKVELTPTRHGPFEARVINVAFDRLHMQRVDESTPRIKWATQSPQRTFVRFLTSSGPPPIIDGIQLLSHEIVHFSKGHKYFEHSFAPIGWAALSLPVEDPAAEGLTIAGRNIALPRSPTHVVPAPHAFVRLKRLHAEVLAIAEARPTALTKAEVSHAIEQSLLDALAECLGNCETHSLSSAHGRHDIIMHRFRRMLEAATDRPLYLPEICDAIKVPERTLRFCCQERLGMSPKHYLLRRRMLLARRALSASDPEITTVTQIAARFGFWHFGRFACCYRLIFGESPSVTLQRRAGRQ